MRLSAKIAGEYRNAKVLPAALVAQQQGGVGPQRPGTGPRAASGPQRKLIEGEWGAGRPRT